MYNFFFIKIKNFFINLYIISLILIFGLFYSLIFFSKTKKTQQLKKKVIIPKHERLLQRKIENDQKRKKYTKNFYLQRQLRQKAWLSGAKKAFQPLKYKIKGFLRPRPGNALWLHFYKEEQNYNDPRFYLTFGDVKYLKKTYPDVPDEYYEPPFVFLDFQKNVRFRERANPFFQKSSKKVRYFYHHLKYDDKLRQYAYKLKMLTFFFFKYTQIPSKKLFYYLNKLSNKWFWSSNSRYSNIEYYLHFQIYLFIKNVFLFYYFNHYVRLTFNILKNLLSFGFLKINNVMIYVTNIQIFVHDFIEFSYKFILFKWGFFQYRPKYVSSLKLQILKKFPFYNIRRKRRFLQIKIKGDKKYSKFKRFFFFSKKKLLNSTFFLSLIKKQKSFKHKLILKKFKRYFSLRVKMYRFFFFIYYFQKKKKNFQKKYIPFFKILGKKHDYSFNFISRFYTKFQRIVRAKLLKLWSFRNVALFWQIDLFQQIYFRAIKILKAGIIQRKYKYNLNARNTWCFFSFRNLAVIPYKFQGYKFRRFSKFFLLQDNLLTWKTGEESEYAGFELENSNIEQYKQLELLHKIDQKKQTNIQFTNFQNYFPDEQFIYDKYKSVLDVKIHKFKELQSYFEYKEEEAKREAKLAAIKAKQDAIAAEKAKKNPFPPLEKPEIDKYNEFLNVGKLIPQKMKVFLDYNIHNGRRRHNKISIFEKLFRKRFSRSQLQLIYFSNISKYK